MYQHNDRVDEPKTDCNGMRSLYWGANNGVACLEYFTSIVAVAAVVIIIIIVVASGMKFNNVVETVQCSGKQESEHDSYGLLMVGSHNSSFVRTTTTTTMGSSVSQLMETKTFGFNVFISMSHKVAPLWSW